MPPKLLPIAAALLPTSPPRSRISSATPLLSPASLRSPASPRITTRPPCRRHSIHFDEPSYKGPLLPPLVHSPIYDPEPPSEPISRRGGGAVAFNRDNCSSQGGVFNLELLITRDSAGLNGAQKTSLVECGGMGVLKRSRLFVN